MASNPGQIPAGGKDKISVVVKTEDRGGSKLNKRFRVDTNDPQNPHVELLVSGQVKGYVSISPPYVRLMGKLGEEIRMSVKIIPEKEYPFTIKGVRAKEQDIHIDLKPLGKNPAHDGYQLIVTSVKKDPGIFHDFIMINTDLKQKPMLRIPVSGRIHARQATGGQTKRQ